MQKITDCVYNNLFISSIDLVKRFNTMTQQETEVTMSGRLQAWQGKTENIPAAQQALLKRARLNHLAMLGEYEEVMENE